MRHRLHRVFELRRNIQLSTHWAGIAHNGFGGGDPFSHDLPPYREFIIGLWLWSMTVRIPHIDRAGWRKLWRRWTGQNIPA